MTTKDPRVLFVAWQSPENRVIYPVGRLTDRGDSPRYEFVYVQGVDEAMEHAFAPLIEFPDVKQVYMSDDLFPLFRNRMMSVSRPDYREYIERLGLGPDADPITVLARSEGRRETDLLELFSPPERDSGSGAYLHHFLVRGVRHIPHADKAVECLKTDDRLYWMLDRQNPFDARAVALRTEDYCLVGFMPHYLVEDLEELGERDARLSIFVEKVNRSPAPFHHRLLCRLEVVSGNGFQPFATSRYRPVAAPVRT